MADGEDLHALVFDAVQDAVDAVTLAVEQLADTSLAKGGLGGKGASLRELSEALDGITQAVEPFQRRPPSEPVEVSLSPLSI
jgi:hypothetical protein